MAVLDRGTKDSAWFDRLAMNVAGDMSRRRAIRTFASASATAILGSWLRPNFAFGLTSQAGGGTCTDVPPGSPCSGTTTFYRANCTNKVTKKSPAVAKFNGCGPENGVNVVPNSPLWLANFSVPCNGHDCCYSTCSKKKSECDTQFLIGMRQICADKYPGYGLFNVIGRQQCAGSAEVFYQAVSQIGDSAYEAAQEARCDCCDDCPGGTPRCGQSCCQRGQKCINGRCCSPCEPGFHACPVAPGAEWKCGYACCSDNTPVCCPGRTADYVRCCNVCGAPGFCVR